MHQLELKESIVELNDKMNGPRLFESILTL